MALIKLTVDMLNAHYIIVLTDYIELLNSGKMYPLCKTKTCKATMIKPGKCNLYF